MDPRVEHKRDSTRILQEKFICKRVEEHLIDKYRSLNLPIGDISKRIGEYETALHYAHDTLSKKDLALWTPEEFITLLKEIHQRLAPKSKPGEFRKDISFVLRHPKTSARYKRPNEAGKMAVFLENYPGHGPKVALNFLIGYDKLSSVPSKKEKGISKSQETILKYYLNKFKDNPRPNIVKEMADPISTHEMNALETIYHFFINHTEIENTLLNLFSDLVKALKMNVDPHQIYGEFYLRFIEIHPFIDENASTIKILLNFFLLKNGFYPINLEDKGDKDYYEHYFGKNPDKNVFLTHIKSHTVEISCAPNTYDYLNRLKIGVGKDIVNFNEKKGKVYFPAFWLKQLGKNAIKELSSELSVSPDKLKRNLNVP